MKRYGQINPNADADIAWKRINQLRMNFQREYKSIRSSIKKNNGVVAEGDDLYMCYVEDLQEHIVLDSSLEESRNFVHIENVSFYDFFISMFLFIIRRTYRIQSCVLTFSWLMIFNMK